ncbi:MAG: twin-arginine translocase subunit TatC [Prevotellaceae bacterium]|jgi:twin arginine-targeting protein translocase tatC|nr:twin-arginine translocase subunit TatC [Prevotellaceae bacterium]
MNDDNLTFWEHVDVLRGCLVRIIVVTVVCGLAAFNFKETLFSIVLAPSRYSFVSYRLLHASPFHINLVNIGLTEQFMIHVKTAFSFGFLVASPYVLYALYRFIAPALYRRERHYAVRVVLGGYVMFVLGLLVNYFIIFPLTVRFLGTYQVSSSVHNMLSLQSYIDTLLMMSLMFGILFEIPVISWLLALFGLLKAEWMQRYWRQALVAIVVIAAVITPTGDAFTLAIVSLPIWLLYEASILIVRAANR